jgi:osmotically-inducible protein OsmY
MTRSDEQIELDIIDQLKWDSRVDVSRIFVEVAEGTVKLTGTVPTYRMREIAAMDALDVEDVRYIDNGLKVKYRSTSSLPSDEQIGLGIEKMLSWDPDIEPENINVTVDNGNVILEGFVDAIWKKLKAEEIISNLNGVLEVVNKLAVVPAGTYIDQTISEGITKALERNVHVNAREVNTKVENQIVTLSGNVPSWKAYHAARDAALYTPGVIQVQNNLVVSRASG